MTPSEILESIRDQVYESTANFWSDDEIYRYMWQAECELAGLIECNEISDSTTLDSTAGTQEYSIPSNFLSVSSVKYGNKLLKKVTKREKGFYDFNDVTSTDFSGEPDSFYVTPTHIVLYPVPPSTGVNITLIGIGQPTKLTTSSTSFSTSQLYHHYYIDYCLARMYAKDQDEVRSDRHMRLWENNIVRAKQKLAQSKRIGKFSVVKDEEMYPTTELGMV